MEHTFSGCYTGVALMLQKDGMTDKAKIACDNYKNTTKMENCIESSKKIKMSI